MKQFLLKFWHLKFLFLMFSKIIIFAKFSKHHVLSVLLMSDLCAINNTNDFLIFVNVIRITLKVPLIRILLSIGS